VRTAVGILVFVGGLVIYSAANPGFHIPEAAWGVAVAAATYFFSTSKREDKQ
jgi:hypothetical protein